VDSSGLQSPLFTAVFAQDSHIVEDPPNRETDGITVITRPTYDLAHMTRAEVKVLAQEIRAQIAANSFDTKIAEVEAAMRASNRDTALVRNRMARVRGMRLSCWGRFVPCARLVNSNITISLLP
jgi:hypothetical protein